jgi:choice-of-anchor B domain-containing protein
MKYIFISIALLIAMSIQAQDSLNMSLLYRYDPDTIPTNGSREFNECFGYVTLEGEEIAILGSSGRVHFFDVTDPANTYEIAWFTGGSITTWRDMKTYKDHVYSVCDACTEGLMIFDMEDAPNSVTLSNQTTAFFGRSHNIFIDECPGRLYSMGTDSLSGGLVVLDIETDPDNPILLKNMTLPGGYVHDMYIKDNLAFCNHGGNGMYAYDFTDLDNPILLGTLTDYPQSGYNHSSWVNYEGNTLVLCDETHNRGVKTVNIEDASNMYVEQVFRSTLLAPADTASIAHNPLVRGNIAFLSYYHDGVAAYDISDPTDVQKVAYYDTEPNNTSYGGFTGCWGVYPFLPSGNILASDMTRGLHVLSLENLDLAPSNITFPPFAAIDVFGNTNLCEGDSLILRADAEADTYTWTNNGDIVGTADSLVVYESGNYSLCVANCLYSNCALSDVEVTVSPYPDVTVSIDGETTFCKGESTVLSVPEGAEVYTWFLNNVDVVSTENSVEVTESGTYHIEASNDGCLQGGGGTEITVIEIDVFPLDLVDNTLSSIEAATYQWYFNDEPIPGATNQDYEVTESGEYFVEITDDNGCTGFSDKTNVIISKTNQIAILNEFSVYPNPTSATLFIKMNSSERGDFSFSLQTIDGKMLSVLEKEITGEAVIDMDLTAFPAGVYLLKVKHGEDVLIKRITKD